MSVSTDLIATWRRPRAIMRKLLAMGKRKDRALAFLIGACLLIFVAQLPLLARSNTLTPDEVPFQAELAATFFAWLLVWPLLFYGIGSVTHLAARLFGGRGTFYTARLALFWSLLASTPAWLFYGLVGGFIGPSPAKQIAGVIVLGSFLLFWSISLREAETNPDGNTP
ncbi:MAG TPA: YIP1 family protein [Roseibacterium sp.]|nr:YIP1 family protein [Roseibacterium sp.]